jgi:outer membrane lipoprotein-sorting protein
VLTIDCLLLGATQQIVGPERRGRVSHHTPRAAKVALNRAARSTPPLAVLTSQMATHLRIVIAVLSLSAVVYPQTPTAREIVNEMVTHYKTISSYQDTGEAIVAPSEPKTALLRNVSFQQPRATETLVSFRTYFNRPDMFRFDWKRKQSERESSVWYDGAYVYTWMPSMGGRSKAFLLWRSDYLTITIDETARYSSGAVFPIISMLVPKASVVSFDGLLRTAPAMTLTREDTVDGETCYVIDTNLSGAPWTLWVGKQTHLLRKTRTAYSYGSFDERVEKGIKRQFVAEETRHDIKINEPIAKDLLKYRPTLLPGDLDATR